jgi:3-methyl-2-oxobutanoate hydroxymethyltransferase
LLGLGRLGTIGHMNARPRRVTAPDFARMKADGHKISMLTAYDFTFARLLDQAGIDAILVGDSLAMVVQGYEDTLPVTLDEMIYHARLVGRAVQRAMVIVDLPFGTYQSSASQALDSAVRILKETRCQAVKLECSADQSDVIRTLVGAGIPVMAHVGLSPQAVHQLGGYKVQRDAERLTQIAQASQDAGAFAILLECIATPIATRVSQSLRVPTIGIGAGPHCDGQVLVTYDMLGLTSGSTPKFVRQYADLGQQIRQAAEAYRADLQSGQFPGPGEGYA